MYSVYTMKKDVMAGVRWEDHLTNEEVAERYCLRRLDGKLTTHGLRWFGHVSRREGEHPLGRPRKLWSKCVSDDLARMEIDAVIALA